MNYRETFGFLLRTAVFMFLAGSTAHAPGQPVQPVRTLAEKEKPALLETMKELVAIESGSADREGSIG